MFCSIIAPHINAIDSEYFKSIDLNIAPEKIKEWDQAHQNLFANVHNAVLYWSEKTKDKWPLKNRIYLTKQLIKSYHEDLSSIEKLERELTML